MTELLSGVEAPSDAELISRVRGGDVAAYGELFSRHVEAARRLGRQLVRGPDVDDLVSDAFAKTLTVLQNGGGPDVAFRAYVLTSVRRLHVDKIRAAKKVQPADDMTVFDDGVPFQDTAVADFENGAAARAFSSLPERWQLVLWHLEVEGQKPADIAPLLGMSANSVSALAYRAREGLRQAFLTMHLADSPTEDCRWVNEHLGAYVRKGLSKRDTAKVDEHLDGCRRCTAMYLELSEVNSNLAGIIAPLLLGAAAAGYVSSAGGAGLTGVSALFGRVRDSVTGGGGSSAGAGTGSAAAGTGAAVTTGGLVTAGGVIAASVAAITAAAFVFGGGPDKELITEADQPVGIVQTPAAPAASDSSDASADERSADAATEDAVVGDATDGLPEEAVDAPVSAADDAGIEPDGTTDVPADVTTGDAPVSGPGADAPGTGDGTVDGPGAAPGDGPSDAPGDAPGDGPGSDPGPDNPGTDNPGTNDPGTDEPGSGPGSQPEPQPSPSPTPSPTPSPSPSPTPSPTEKPLVGTKLSVSALGVVDGTVSLSFTDAPPGSSVQLRVQSDPTGVDIAAGGDCSVDPANPGAWLCSPSGAPSPSPFTRMLASAVSGTDGDSTYTVDFPLGIPADQADLTKLTFEYLLEGEDVDPGSQSLSEPLRIANVGLSAESEATTATAVPDVYWLTGSVPAVPGDVTTRTYTLSGDATFLPNDVCIVGDDPKTAMCSVTPAGGPVDFLVSAAGERASATPVTIAAASVPGFIDPDVTNNTAAFTLPASLGVSLIGLDARSPYWDARLSITGVDYGDSPTFVLVDETNKEFAVYPRITEVNAGGENMFVVTIHMPPGQGVETVRLKLLGTDFVTESFDVGTVGSGNSDSAQ